MSIVALELQDAGLLVADASDPEMPAGTPSPGYALLDGDRLLTGSAALSRARLKPRHVQNRFWSELDTEPLGRPFPKNLSRADLAHAHLSHVWELTGSGVEEVILAVPGTHSDAQLGLILGIAHACGMPVSGMVDAATAAGMLGWPGARLLHIDLQLHRVVVSELTQADEVVRGRVESLEAVGLVGVQDTLARTIAEIFLQQTRFDPTHSARTEQRLYDGLPYWLARLRSDDGIALRFESSGREYGVKLTRNRLVEALSAEYRRIGQLVSSLKPAGETTTLLLSHRIAQLPGLEAQLGEIRNTHVVVLPETAAAAGALACREVARSTDEEMPFVTRVPARPGVAQIVNAAPVEPDAEPAQPLAADQPTHLLLEGTAHAITETPLVLGLAIPEGARGFNLEGPSEGISRSHCSIFRRGPEVLVEDHSSHGSFLNGERVEGRSVLTVGDRLRLGSPGVELQLIRVVEGDGPAQG